MNKNLMALVIVGVCVAGSLLVFDALVFQAPGFDDCSAWPLGCINGSRVYGPLTFEQAAVYDASCLGGVNG